VVRFKATRRALPALALTTDTSMLTAIGNDLGFEHLVLAPDRGAGSARRYRIRHLDIRPLAERARRAGRRASAS
jgi:hypothetical protein